MTNLTTKQVGAWLQSIGFELYVTKFSDKQIDGTALLALSDDAIVQLLSLSSEDEKQNKAAIKKFKKRLEQLKADHKEDSSRHRKEQRNPATLTSSTMVTSSIHEDLVTEKSINPTYTKILTISHDSNRVSIHFFNDPLFCVKLQQYLYKTYGITCSIESEQKKIILTLVGTKHQVKNGCGDIIILFESTQTKIYNSESVDRKAIYWSKHIFSDATISVIQQIMNNEKLFTVWEKSEMFSGFYKVVYFTHESFAASEESITQILNREIAFVEYIKMPNEKTKTFLDEIEQFIITAKQPELAVIRCKYPFKMEINVSLFGRKKLVKTVKKQIELLVKKHTVKSFGIKMTPAQHIYLVDNYLQRFKDIENDYKNDNVKIRIRQKEFYAPQYLIETIKQHINELICHTTTCIIQTMENSISLTDDEKTQLIEIAKRYYCSIERIESNTEVQICSIPIALTKTSSTSTAMIQQSKAFCSSLSVKKISVLNSSIEVYTADHSMPLLVSKSVVVTSTCILSIQEDVIVVSTDAGAIQERIECVHKNGFYGTSFGRKVILCHWQHLTRTNCKTGTELKRLVTKFISIIAKSITADCPDAEKIAFLTHEWENFGNETQFAEEFIFELKRVLEKTKPRWRLLFMFNHEQNQLCEAFFQAMIRLQSDEDGFAQFSCPLSKKRVLLQLDLKTFQLSLTGSAKNVEKAIEKYKLMSEILILKSSTRSLSLSKPGSSTVEKKQSDSDNHSSYNIAFSYCKQDKIVCRQITTFLSGEGYSLCHSSFNRSLSYQQIERSDVLLIYFSETYTKDVHCMSDLNYAESIGKQIIPVAVMKSMHQETEENTWLQSVTNAQLFYDLFDTEIEIEFEDDFDMECDKLLATLLRHTKPGVTGQLYPQATSIMSETKQMNTINEQVTFGHVSMKLQNVTDEQREEGERTYRIRLKQRMEKEKIPSDEVDVLICELKLVMDDLNAILRGENPDSAVELSPRDRYSYRRKDIQYSKVLTHAILNCIKRWLKKAPNYMKKNVAPFTPTGDINDATFRLYESTNHDWWKPDYEPFATLPPQDYFSLPKSNPGSWFTAEQAQDCFQLLIKHDRAVNTMNMKLDNNETAWDTVSISEVDSENATNEEDDIDDQWKTPEEIKKIQELDNPKRRWKRKNQFTEAFMRQKLQNIIEFQQLCDRQTSIELELFHYKRKNPNIFSVATK
ncbi:unnamed protein product [Rotaria socialis]|uniref:SAM domain-containing protein n=1 Tax=Rotaria socialis TaxID=392032 RepID=A0A817SX88_9BILA|nr:unnamed protein product [Rotaria socialis]